MLAGGVWYLFAHQWNWRADKQQSARPTAVDRADWVRLKLSATCRWGVRSHAGHDGQSFGKPMGKMTPIATAQTTQTTGMIHMSLDYNV